MVGKGAIIAVLGFLATFAIYQLNMNKTMTSNSENFNEQYIQTAVHHAAISAANYAINHIWDTETDSGSFNFKVNGYDALAEISNVGGDTVQLKAVAWGTGFDEGEFSESRNLRTYRDSVVIFFNYNTPFSKYFWFTNTEGLIYFISGDTMNGRFHTNDLVLTFGSPVFKGKVTSMSGISPDPLSILNQAIFENGWEIGVSVSIPTDFQQMVDAATSGNGGAPMNTRSLYNKEMTLDFQPNGDVIRSIDSTYTTYYYRWGWRWQRTVTTTVKDTMPLTQMAPSGVIYSTRDVNVKGTLNGVLSILSDNNIIIVDDVQYLDNPRTNLASDDILGLVAHNDIIVADNAATRSGDVIIQAAMMAATGSFYAQNYASRAIAGDLRITGSIVQDSRGGVGTFSRSLGTVLSGFSKDYRFDERFSGANPPYYPFVRSPQLLSWWE